MSNDSKSKQSVRRGPGGGPGFGPPGGMPGEKPKNFKGTMRKLLAHLRPYIPQMAVALVFAAAGTIFAIQGPKIMGNATTEIFNGITGKMNGMGAGIDFDALLKILMFLVGLYALSAAFSFIQGFVLNHVSQKISYGFRKALAEKVNRLPLKYFDTKTHGEILSRVTNDVDTIGTSLNQGLTQVVTSVMQVFGVLIMMLTISVPMTLVALLIIPISLGLVMVIVKLSQKYFKQQQEYLGHVNGQIEETFGGHMVVKAFNAEERAVEDFDKLNGTLYKSAWKSQFLSGVMMPIMNFVGNLGYVAVSVMGSYFAVRKTIEVGDILSFIQYVRNFTMPMSQLAQIANVFQSTAAAAERVFEFLEEDEESADPADAAAPDNVQGAVAFDRVRFGYNADAVVIKDFSASVAPGQRIAIVGPTGAGKTTIVKLLMRFYELNAGKITIDGVPIPAMTRRNLRQSISMVLQDTWLFNGSIMENIRYGKLDASDNDVIRAAKAAHVDHFVRTLPGSYQMELNEEASNISQGQKQLLTIARAILSDPKILILDEATSSVDTRTEVLIQKAMDSLMQGRTSFIIAHRLSTIRNADLILVMNEGDIVEQGKHEALLAQGGFYANLYNSQFEGEMA